MPLSSSICLLPFFTRRKIQNQKFLIEKHLHMRGADLAITTIGKRVTRNISTCVEQIVASRSSTGPSEKHLHMRGADACDMPYEECGVETSPHAWSRSKLAHRLARQVGNISTCVEQMYRQYKSAHRTEKHLHMRGADHHQAQARNHM